MKRPAALFLALLLLTGCAAGEEAAGEEETALLTGETVSGIITKVNGNEITLDLVTFDQPSAGPSGEERGEPREEAPSPGQSGDAPGEQPRQGEGRSRQREGGGSGRPREQDAPAAGGMELPQGGGEPPFQGGTVSASSRQSYTRTGETALYQIPVGAAVLTLTGTSRGFNSLSTDLLVTITFREDGVTPGQVQVIQSLS